MSEDDRDTRSLEIALTEKVYTRLKYQMLVFYLISFVFALGIRLSLLWEYRATSELADARLSEYRLMVAEKLDELHRLDLEEVARATQPVIECKSPMPREDAVELLILELGRSPKETRVSQLLEEADGFGVCDIGEIRHILDDTASMARVDTVYRLHLWILACQWRRSRGGGSRRHGLSGVSGAQEAEPTLRAHFFVIVKSEDRWRKEGRSS